MHTVRLALHAMATRFELVLQGDDAVRLRAAGEMALAEIERLETLLSFYRPTSEVSRINAEASERPVRVTPRVFGLLRRAQALWQQTEGAFDPTVGPLMRAWGFVSDTGHRPDADALDAARARTGLQNVTLDADARTIRFERPGMEIDLGGIGKGYALDEALALLHEAGIERALLHGGTSTVGALGTPHDAEAWTVAIPAPGRDAADPSDVLATVALHDEALSVSAVWGKAFEAEGRVFGHVLDPRRGVPVEGALLAAVVHANATDADALSTALLVGGRAALPTLAAHQPNLRALVAEAGTEPDTFAVSTHRLAAHNAASSVS